MTKSGGNCKTLTQKSIKLAKDKFDCVVTCVVTDNARKMDNMKDGPKEDDFSLHDFVEMALQLLSAHGSSASTERSF